MTPTLTSDLKQSLLSVSANALRSCLPYQSFDVSFENIHKIAKKVPPNNLCTIKSPLVYTNWLTQIQNF